MNEEPDHQGSAVPRLQPGTTPGGGVPVAIVLPERWQRIVERVRAVVLIRPDDAGEQGPGLGGEIQ